MQLCQLLCVVKSLYCVHVVNCCCCVAEVNLGICFLMLSSVSKIYITMPVFIQTKARVVTDIKIIEEHTTKVRKECSNTHIYCSAIVLCVCSNSYNTSMRFVSYL